MAKRIISGLIGIPILIYIIQNGGIVLDISILLITLLGLNEFYNSFKKINIIPFNYLSYFFSITTFITILYNNKSLILFNILALTYALLINFLFKKKATLVDISITILGFLYIPLSLFHIIFLARLNISYFIWFVFIIAWATDTFAYFSGYLFGSKKLYPEVSPKKTIEGSIGGVVGSIIISGIYSYIFIPEFILHSILLGFIGSIVSQIGDLIASKIKRYVGIKDFGNIIPGHGGIIDRFDSILLVSPLIYYYVVYIY